MAYDLKIGDVCRLYGITPDTLRHYEAKGLIHPWRDPASGYRYYSVAELDVIDLILAARTLGIPLAEIRRVIESEDVAAYREMYERQQCVITERIQALTVLARVTARKQQTLAALTAHLAHDAAAPAGTQTLYLVDVATLFAIEAGPEEMAGLEALSTWRVFVRDEAGTVCEDPTLAGFSFASGGDLTPLERGFQALVDAGMAKRQILPAACARCSFWGDDAALAAHLTALDGERFLVEVRYSLLHADGQHEHFVDIVAENGEIVTNQ